MPSLKSHARWDEALRSTVALWLFVLFVFLPVIIRRHHGEPWTGVALDCSTIIVSMGLAMVMFLASRATIGMPALIRLPLRASAVIVTAAANTTFDLLFQGWIADHVYQAWQSLPADFSRAYSSMFNYIMVFGVNMILFHVNYARRAGIQQERRIAEANMAAQQAQLAALRYQLNPHFLFNSLNSISALIVTGRNKDAEAMTNRLSGFLRSSLYADPTGLIPLDEELALTEEYLDIESVRFGERLVASVDCAPDACAALVPSFLVQPLVENAVKHGVARSSAPIEIEIGAAIVEGRLLITVANCLAPADADAGEAQFNAGPVDGRFVATISIPEAPGAD
jgi:sulfur relay (sulfurtransferase) DsrF/TusC family protein